MDRAPAQRFEDLIVWQKSHAVTLAVYRTTLDFPRHELYGLTAQMRRAAVSVAANIAEGFKRRSKPDKARVMNIAQGSLEELRYYFVLARDLDYWKQPRFAEVDEVGRLLTAYIRSLVGTES
jgi:four helix bundle protein